MAKKKRRPVKKRYAAQNYLFISYVLCWSIVGLLYLFEQPLQSTAGFGASVLYMIIPAGVVLFIYNKQILERLELALYFNGGFAWAFFLPLFLVAAAFGATLLWPGVEFSWGMEDLIARLAQHLPPDQLPQIPAEGLHPFWGALIQGVVMGATISAFFAFGEELGWRGLLVKEWEKLGFWRSAYQIGFVWGLWYAPLVLMGHNYPQNPLAGVFMTLVWCVLLSPLMQWVRLRAKSVAAAALFHGVINGAAGVSLMPLKGGGELISGILGLPGLGVLAFANLFLFLLVRPTNPQTVKL